MMSDNEISEALNELRQETRQAVSALGEALQVFILEKTSQPAAVFDEALARIRDAVRAGEESITASSLSFGEGLERDAARHADSLTGLLEERAETLGRDLSDALARALTTLDSAKTAGEQAFADAAMLRGHDLAREAEALRRTAPVLPVDTDQLQQQQARIILYLDQLADRLGVQRIEGI